MDSLTIETKVWEKDWRFILTSGFLRETMARLSPLSSHRLVMINNVEDPRLVARHAETLVSAGVIDDFIFVSDYADETLSFFGLSKRDLGRGYYYSISELVSLYLCRTEFLLHFSGDTKANDNTPINWYHDALKLLAHATNVSVVNLTWDSKFREAEKDSLSKDDKFFYGYGFSDQMYLVRTADFKNQIYGYSHPESRRYPAHGGESFEKRVDSWMRTNGRLRATSRDWAYTHSNFPNWCSPRGLLWRILNRYKR